MMAKVKEKRGAKAIYNLDHLDHYLHFEIPCQDDERLFWQENDVLCDCPLTPQLLTDKHIVHGLVGTFQISTRKSSWFYVIDKVC